MHQRSYRLSAAAVIYSRGLVRPDRRVPAMRLTALIMAACVSIAMAGGPASVRAEEPTVLTVFGAGTLAVPFKEIGRQFQQRHPEVRVQAQFGGSVKMAKQITELHQEADILAVADYS